MMRRVTQVALAGVLVLVLASLAAAQGTMQLPSGSPQPALRLGNFIEIGNDVFMHIIASGDFRYQTTTNFDFDRNVRDRTPSRNPVDTVGQGGEGDTFWMLSRFGVDFRYQKSTELQIVLEQRTYLDGNTSDDRFNSTNPGGTDVFGRAATTENKGYYCKYCWLDYKFEGTPLRMRVGFDLWTLDQAGTIGDNDPRFALFGEFGDLDVTAAAAIEYESQRLGLTNDNDLLYYTFSVGYNMKPHRFQFDVTYFRDRFAGADLSAPRTTGSGIGFQGQKTDSVLVMASWSGQAGPVRALVQGSAMVGHAKGANAGGIAIAGLTGARGADRDYDILAGSAVAYAEADLGIVRPFVMVLWASGDGDPTDHKLRGFSSYPYRTTTQMSGTSWFAHLDTSNAFSARDYTCPSRAQGLGIANVNAPGGATSASPGAPGLARNPENVGIAALGGTPSGGFTECGHTVTNPFNDRLSNTSHLGINTTLGNPGTLLLPVGVRVFPLKGYEVNAWYMYRAMLDTTSLEIAFAPELAARGISRIRKAEYQEIGGSILWTLNPNFDIRLSGNVAIPSGGYIDLAHLGNCNSPGGGGAYVGSARCSGADPALHGEARIRARF